jgi:hypothetical protein
MDEQGLRAGRQRGENIRGPALAGWRILWRGGIVFNPKGSLK